MKKSPFQVLRKSVGGTDRFIVAVNLPRQPAASRRLNFKLILAIKCGETVLPLQHEFTFRSRQSGICLMPDKTSGRITAADYPLAVGCFHPQFETDRAYLLLFSASASQPRFSSASAGCER